MTVFSEKMKELTLSHLNKVLQDMQDKGWDVEAKKVKKQIAYVKAHGHMPSGR